MSDIVHAVAAAGPQPRRALSPRGFGSRERILKRCRELMLAGTFRPTTKELETATLTPKVIRYYFDTQEGLYEAALDAATAYAIARFVLGSPSSWVSTDDVARVARAAVFGRLHQ